MVEVAWSAIGLLAATLFGSLYWLGSRIDALESKLGSRIDNLSARIDSLDSKLGARIDNLTARLDIHLQGHSLQ
jgi:hypothetical protein